MSEFHVTWDIEVNGDNARDAARKAREIQTDPNSTATVFTVTDDKGHQETVDLEEDKQMKNSLTLDQIIAIADKGYSDGLIGLNFNTRTQRPTRDHHGDSLAGFIVAELCDTFDPKAQSFAQVAEAERVIVNAKVQLDLVQNEFKKEFWNQYKEANNG